MTATLPETHQEIQAQIQTEIDHTAEIHTPIVLPAGHRVLMATVKNADILTLTRDGLEKTIKGFG